MTKSAITQLTEDHRRVERLFSEFESCTPRAHKRMADLRDKIVDELSVHAAIEERVFYPVVTEALPDAGEDIREGLTEHAVAEQLLAQVAGMATDDEWFRPRMFVLIESVRHHVREEEGELFPQVRDALSREDLAELGEALDEARETAPHAPPPSAQTRAVIGQVTDRAADILHRIGAKVGVGH